MGKVVTVGLDIAKSVFQVHGVDAGGELGNSTVVHQHPMVRAVECCGGLERRRGFSHVEPETACAR